MSFLNKIILKNMDLARQYVTDAFDRISKRYTKMFDVNSDSDIFEKMLTEHGYTNITVIDRSSEIVGNLQNRFSNNRFRENFIAFEIGVQKEGSSSVIPLNCKVSTSKNHKDKLYLSLKHKSPGQKRKYPEKYWVDTACCSTPFIQLFTDSSEEVVNEFFMILDGLSEIKTEDDCTRYLNYTCKIVKNNREIQKTLDKL